MEGSPWWRQMASAGFEEGATNGGAWAAGSGVCFQAALGSGAAGGALGTARGGARGWPPLFMGRRSGHGCPGWRRRRPGLGRPLACGRMGFGRAWRPGRCGHGRAGAGRAFGLGPFQVDRFSFSYFLKYIFSAKEFQRNSSNSFKARKIQKFQENS
jgi:hypothetical protein